MGNGCHRRETAEDVDARAARITEVAEGDSAIINMPSAGSHKSRVIEFSTSITGRRSARPQEIGRNGTYLERELDDSIPLSKGAVLFESSSFFFFFFLPFSFSLLPALSFFSSRRAIDRNANRLRDVQSRRLFLIRPPDRAARRKTRRRSALVFLRSFLCFLPFSDPRRAKRRSFFDADI